MAALSLAWEIGSPGGWIRAKPCGRTVRARLVLEGTRARKDHRHPALVAGLDGLFVFYAAPGLDDRGNARPADRLHRITAGEGEEGIGGQDCAARPLAGVLQRVLRRPEPVRLTATDAHRRPAFGYDD